MNASAPPSTPNDTGPNDTGHEDAAIELARRLVMIVAGLVALVARRFLREPKLMGLTVRLCGWLGRSAQRFGRAMTRHGAVRTARAGRVRATRTSRAGAMRLPTGRGWLVGALGYEAASYGGYLTLLLAEPGMQAILARSPAAARILRPLCRMLWMPGVVELEKMMAPPEKVARVARAPSPEVTVAVDAVSLPAAAMVCSSFANYG